MTIDLTQPVDGYTPGQVNGQVLDITGYLNAALAQYYPGYAAGTGQTVTVTNYGVAQSNADAAGEGNQSLGSYIANHPFLINTAWTLGTGTITPNPTPNGTVTPPTPTPSPSPGPTPTPTTTTTLTNSPISLPGKVGMIMVGLGVAAAAVIVIVLATRKNHNNVKYQETTM